jgi:hypothetical protein
VSRLRLDSQSAWHTFLEQSKDKPINLYLQLRVPVYREIEELRGRPLLVYAVQWPNAPANAPISIDHSDVDGFMDLVDSVPSSTEVDIVLHSPGGSPEATERIVDILRDRFEKVCFLIPSAALSAATMLALSGDEVVLHPAATLGPIDPQVNGIPARSIQRGFERVREVLKDEGPEALPAYLPLLEKQSLEVLEMCADFLSLSRELVSGWLAAYMFKGDASTATSEVILRASEFFSDYDHHKTHGRPLSFRKVQHLGLKIVKADPQLASLLREVHVVLNGTFAMTHFVKVYENSSGLSWGRNYIITNVGQAQPQSPPPPTPKRSVPDNP